MVLRGINDSGSLWTGMLQDVHGYAESIQAVTALPGRQGFKVQ